MNLTDTTQTAMPLPQRTVLEEDESIVTVSNFLSPEECEEYIRLTLATGYEEAPITTFRGFVMRPDIRNNTRVIRDDRELADRLWERMQGWVPTTHRRIGSWHPHNLNERFRFYRYTGGQYFKWHSDGPFIRSQQEVSLFTAMVYLNEDFEGGTTDFQFGPTVTPRRGMLLLFEHSLVHQGAPVRSGCKYVLRTDVMFRP
ncbi:2OG-Fe(II) oxygenase [Hyalangium rubrum]|uniref:2OG-Fe(II) oxygenase n=1 Tax=Hyalangium rubrum TaxID=3103134 RepID=A0ABU5H180_9BACT|nr:2OG-Fe(II) oxygenase [Hyalangium sp. s54d21]MDY7226679.1 2OG-Fe(II) oxygenase [Hyalangium sp. s54d21]